MRRKKVIPIDYCGTMEDVYKRRDTFEPRHIAKGVWTWRLVWDKVRALASIPVINPVLSISRSALKVYTDTVNRVTYRKTHYRPEWHNNGISRFYRVGSCHKNFCPDCVEQIDNVRVTKGVYLPIDHECPRTRLYDLQGNLLEVNTKWNHSN